MLDSDLRAADPDGEGARPLVPRQAARARPAPRLQHDATDWQARVDFDRLRTRSAGAGAHDDGEARPRRAGVLRRRERPLHHERLPGQLEEQHLHPLLRAPARRRAGAVRDRRLRPGVREDRRAVAERQHPAGDHVEVGRDRRVVHGREDGRLRARRAQGERGREGADRPRRLRPERLRGLPSSSTSNIVSAWPAMSGARIGQDAGRDRVPEDLLGDRRHVVLEDRARVAQAGRQGVGDHREGQRVPLRRRASTSSTTSSSPRAATPARTGAGTPTR